MRNLWAPWRIEYILGKKPPGCIFCPETGAGPTSNFLSFTGASLVMVMMNRFPYNNGHLLVFPGRHISSLDELTAGEDRDLMDWIKRSTRALQKVMHPDGFNIGLNLGREAGQATRNICTFISCPGGEAIRISWLLSPKSAVSLNTYSNHIPNFYPISGRRAPMRLFKVLVTLLILCLICHFHLSEHADLDTTCQLQA